MDMTIDKWGNSLGLRIPSALAKTIGLRRGDRVRLAARQGRIVIEPVATPEASLAALLAKITPGNLHAGIETGPATGREIW